MVEEDGELLEVSHCWWHFSAQGRNKQHEPLCRTAGAAATVWSEFPEFPEFIRNEQQQRGSSLLSLAERLKTSQSTYRRGTGENCSAYWVDTTSTYRNFRWLQEEQRVCDLHGGVRQWRQSEISSMHAHLSHRVYRRLAYAILHLPLLYGTCRCSSISCLRDKLRAYSDWTWVNFKLIKYLSAKCQTYQLPRDLARRPNV